MAYHIVSRGDIPAKHGHGHTITITRREIRSHGTGMTVTMLAVFEMFLK